jgi:hypothetical protein
MIPKSGGRLSEKIMLKQQGRPTSLHCKRMPLELPAGGLIDRRRKR